MLRIKGDTMYDLTEAIEIYEEEKRHNPEYDAELVAEWREDMPEEFTRKMLEKRYGCHIRDEKTYNTAVGLLVWPDERTRGPKWSLSDIRNSVNVDLRNKKYTLFDFAYVMNMLWSDFSNVFTDSNYYAKMSIGYLEDSDYMGDPSERAYKDAMKRIRYFKER